MGPSGESRKGQVGLSLTRKAVAHFIHMQPDTSGAPKSRTVNLGTPQPYRLPSDTGNRLLRGFDLDQFLRQKKFDIFLNHREFFDF